MIAGEPQDERERIMVVAVAIADAIRDRNVARLRQLLAPDFVHRHAGAESSDVTSFLTALERIPGEIVSVNLARVAIDIAGDGALVTGVQHARVRLDDEVIDDTRPFIDWMVNVSGQWRLRAAVALPTPDAP